METERGSECRLTNLQVNGSIPETYGPVCDAARDRLSCWPMTPAGQLAQIPCPREYRGVAIEGNATRLCLENGTWQTKGNYTLCVWHLRATEESLHNFVTRVIYYVGFTASAVALTIALFIFLYFRSLHCLRNTIHCHLIVAFILKNLLWLKLDSLLPKINENEDIESLQWICKLIVALFNYLQLSTFSWMLIEGIYLYTIIVWAYNASRIRLRYYVIIGWGWPSLFIVAWAIVKARVENVECWLAVKNSYFNYIFITPILCVLLINFIILGSIVWILITKLKESNSHQTVQYRKAMKATLVLFPLLGMTYLLFITNPSRNLVTQRVFTYTNNVLQSTQGLLVAIFYCFLNAEVQGVVLSRLRGWRESRRVTNRYARGSSSTYANKIQTPKERHNPSPNPASAARSAAVDLTIRGSADGVSVPATSAVNGSTAGTSSMPVCLAARVSTAAISATFGSAAGSANSQPQPYQNGGTDGNRDGHVVREPRKVTSLVRAICSKSIAREDMV